MKTNRMHANWPWSELSARSRASPRSRVWLLFWVVSPSHRPRQLSPLATGRKWAPSSPRPTSSIFRVQRDASISLAGRATNATGDYVHEKQAVAERAHKCAVEILYPPWHPLYPSPPPPPPPPPMPPPPPPKAPWWLQRQEGQGRTYSCHREYNPIH